MDKNLIFIETAKRTGIINAENEVSYSVKVNGRQMAVVTYILLASVQETIANRCCFFGKQTCVVEPNKLRTRMEAEGGTVAELVVPEGYKLVQSALDGQAVIVEKDCPWCCNPASETYWSM